jgi:xanthine/CO dehydrogenase XdhC/CoxF family maturation factor
MTEQSTYDGVLDGNALAGPLREIFADDVTSVVAVCTGCGLAGPVATLLVWPHAPGLVARCPGCEQVVLRLVRGPDRAWLDLRGTVRLEFRLTPEEEAPATDQAATDQAADRSGA